MRRRVFYLRTRIIVGGVGKLLVYNQLLYLVILKPSPLLLLPHFFFIIFCSVFHFPNMYRTVLFLLLLLVQLAHSRLAYDIRMASQWMVNDMPIGSERYSGMATLTALRNSWRGESV